MRARTHAHAHTDTHQRRPAHVHATYMHTYARAHGVRAAGATNKVYQPLLETYRLAWKVTFKKSCCLLPPVVLAG